MRNKNSQETRTAYAFRAGNEVADHIDALTAGASPAFASVQEYLYSLVAADMGWRRSIPQGCFVPVTQFEQLMQAVCEHQAAVVQIKETIDTYVSEKKIRGEENRRATGFDV